MTTTTALTTELSTQIVAINETALTIQVKDTPTYERAAGFLTKLKTLQKGIATYFKPLKDAAHAAHKAITTREGEELAKLNPVETYLKTQIGAYQEEERRKVKAEQDRLDALARAEQVRLDALARAEQARLEAERKIEQARLNAIAAAEQKAEQDRRAAAAAKAKAEGDAAEAARIAALPPPVVVAAVVAPIVAPVAHVVQRQVVQVPQAAAGVSTREVWSFEVTDANAIPREFLDVNEAAIRARVQLLKGDTKIAGVRVFKRIEVIARG